MTLEESLKTKKSKQMSLFLYYFVKVTGLLPGLFFLPRIVFKNKEMKRIPKGKMIIISNHTSYTDVPAIICAFWYRQVHFLATKELFETRIGNYFFRHMLCIKVDRDNLSMNVMREVGDVLKKQKPVAIFPEGHIYPDSPEIKAFKSGVALMAVMNNSPILPVYLIKPEGKLRKILVVGDLLNIDYHGRFPSVNELEEISENLRSKEIELENYYKETYDGRL